MDGLVAGTAELARHRGAAPEALDIGIEGMTCASCAGRVERAVARVPGVSAVSVNLATEQARIQFDGRPGTAAAVAEAVTKMGYGVVSQEITLEISGMTCAYCVGRVERALKAVPGVTGAEVNLATERARVLASAVVTAEGLAAAVAAAGYEARPLSPGGADSAAQASAEDRAQDRVGERSRRDILRVLAAASLSAPLLAGMVGHLFGVQWMLNCRQR